MKATAEQKNLTAILRVCVDCDTFTALKVQCSQKVYKFPKFVTLEIKRNTVTVKF